ncbi:hypothetical protein CROQUDRAFT_98793 [Cronartium quercuum f. sp. fusiforme G11]|uniref:Uncharacterized protein n=1 Tax=Cronartium quercuum f. sp. fusiforme G11 TaxID=708437 RepID=A0A9P6T707_9BASI|nr:hypothetical protein CROQUDRAFT_98793 [Cronartium quercuum f. sp. fusiforme G11]
MHPVTTPTFMVPEDQGDTIPEWPLSSTSHYQKAEGVKLMTTMTLEELGTIIVWGDNQ